MFNEGNQIHNFMSSSGSGTVINYGSGSGSDFLTSYGSVYGSGSTNQKVTVPTVPVPVPVPVPQHCLWLKDPVRGGSKAYRRDPDLQRCFFTVSHLFTFMSVKMFTVLRIKAQ